MKQKELSKTFLMISNWQKTFGLQGLCENTCISGSQGGESTFLLCIWLFLKAKFKMPSNDWSYDINTPYASLIKTPNSPFWSRFTPLYLIHHNKAWAVLLSPFLEKTHIPKFSPPVSIRKSHNAVIPFPFLLVYIWKTHKGPCQVKKIPDIPKKLDTAHPTPHPFFLETNLRHDFCGFYWFSNFLVSIQNGPGSTHPLQFFWMFGICLTLQHP